MRIAIVAECFLPARNGVTNSVLRVVEQLERRGVETLVIAPGAGPSSCGSARVERLPGLTLPLYRELSIALPSPRLGAALEEFAPDAIHLAAPAVLGALTMREATRLGIPVVAVYQTDYAGFAGRYHLGPLSPVVWRLLRGVHQQAATTLAPSTSAAWRLSHHGIDRVALWGRGVDLDRFDPRHRSELLHRRLARNGEVLVGYMGRLAREKRIELLAHADLPGTKLVVVGDGPDRTRLERRLPGATFLGYRSGAELSEVLATLDVFVHTGADETFCQSVQEALAAGVPVVAPARGGPLDLVRHRENGFLFPPDDPDQLRGAVQALVADATLRRKLGKAARRSVEARTWERLGDELVGHYERAIGLPAATHRGPAARRRPAA